MAGGLSFASFAGKIGVCRDTLYEWCAKHRAFSDAKRKGEAASLLFWEQLGLAAVLGIDVPLSGGRKVEGRKVSPALWIFTMKCRFRDEGWTEEAPPSDPSKKKRAFNMNYHRKAKA